MPDARAGHRRKGDLQSIPGREGAVIDATIAIVDSGYYGGLEEETSRLTAYAVGLGLSPALWALQPVHTANPFPAGVPGCTRTTLLRYSTGGDFSAQDAARVLDERIDKADGPVLFAGGMCAPDVAAFFALRRNLPVLLDARRIELLGDELRAEKSAYSSRLTAAFSLPLNCVLTFARGALPNQKPKDMLPGAFTVEELPAVAAAGSPPTQVEWRQEENPLLTARLVVAAGRGVASSADLKELARTARLLGGEPAASRPIVTNGWMEHRRLLGVSGEVVSPEVCIACGVSGTPAFLYGVGGAGTLIAVNTDPDAELFQSADLGVVADYREFLEGLRRLEEENRVTANETLHNSN